MANRKSVNIYILQYFMTVRNCINIFVLLIRGTFRLTCSYIGELRNGRKFKCENKSFIVFILILRRVCFNFYLFIQFELTAVGMNST